MDNAEILDGPSFCPIEKPKKLIFLLHGYGDNADNFVHIAGNFSHEELNANYFALNAPNLIANYPTGREWFNLYPNNIYISEAGPEEIKIIRSEIRNSTNKIFNTINIIKNKYKLKFSDCFVVGFSQGGMMTFEFGNFSEKQLGGLAILSGRIMTNESPTNLKFLKTPLFISHGDNDDVLNIDNFYSSCNYLKENNFLFEKHLLEGDTHTISPKAINLLQKFIKKNL
ncbi:alpha/beta hydrolase [Alphaproteobacteria bacterium]|nr:alpha/beta hydrolase [Alphaproteobacteria bacterium]